MANVLFIAALLSAPPGDGASGVEFFEKKIRPVLAAQCYECHSAKARILQANLLLDTREGIRRGGDSGPAVVPKEVGESLLIEALRYESFEMPPKGKLSDEVLADFVKWIELGAPDPHDGKSAAPKAIDVVAGRDHWAYRPPNRLPPPNVTETAEAASEIDRYVSAALNQAGLHPVGEAEASALVRRLHLDRRRTHMV